MKTAPLFHPFRSDISKIGSPKQFTYPFFYQPHALTKAAAKELQAFLSKGTLVHNFGLGTHESLIEQGKMFGVLVVKDSSGTLGWLRLTNLDCLYWAHLVQNTICMPLSL